MTCRIVIKSFFEDYNKVTKEKEHYVVYMPSAEDNGFSLITRKVKELIEIEDDHDPLNFMAVQARERRDVIVPAYQNWVKGVGDPDVPGWPLSAWQGVTKGEVDILRHYGFRVVEDLATAPDHKLDGIALPNPLAIKARAMRFLASGDQERSASAMAEKDAKIERLEARVEEMMELMQLMVQKADQAPVGIVAEDAKEAKPRGRAKSAEAAAATA
jgi:hypothetical protein